MDMECDEHDATLATRLMAFDAGKAECSFDDDKQHLCAVIEASFGTFAPFNRLVRGLLREKVATGWGAMEVA